MPTKRNKAGNQQNYVPKGNGDASGEYGDNATGSNKHFTTFAKGGGENKVDNADKKFGETKEKTTTEEQVAKIKEINNKWIDLSNNAKRETLYGNYKNKQLKTMSVEEYENKQFKSYFEMYSYFKMENIATLNDEQKELFVNNAIDEILTDSELPSFTTEEDFLSLLPDSLEGKARLMRNLNFGEYQQEETMVYQKLFTQLYGEELEKIKSKVNEKINGKRAVLGKEYIENNFTKVNDGFSMEEALKRANPNYKKMDNYDDNCQRCSFTYELLRRGYNVSANPSSDDRLSSNRRWTKQMCWKETHDIATATYNGAKKSIEQIVKDAGNGARYCIGCQWKTGSGHCFIAENVNGNVMFIDAQDGSSDCGDYFKRIQSKSPIFLGRMDNADFSQSVKYTATGVKE